MVKPRINSAFWTATALLGAGAVAVVAWATLAPLPDFATPGDAGQARTPHTRPSAVPAIESFEPIWEARLRRPLGDGEPEQADADRAPPPAGASPPLTLVGTIGTSLAMLRTPSAQVEVRGVGETLLGAEVVAVRPAQVDLRYNGKLVTLSRPPEQPLGR